MTGHQDLRVAPRAQERLLGDVRRAGMVTIEQPPRVAGHRMPVLFVHGVNDSRVEVWHSTKMAARLTAANPANVALLRLDYDAGHGSGSTRAQHQEELADMWSFVLWRAGDPAFQPTGPAGN